MTGLAARVRRLAIRGAAAALHVKHELAARGLPVTDNERRLLALRGHHRGQRCFIIGGGPSLQRTNLAALRGEVTFCVNGFFHMLDQLGYVPTYYVVEDRLVAEDNARAINAMRGPVKIFPEDLRYRLHGGPDTVFLQFHRFYCDPDDPGPEFPRFLDERRLAFFWGGTVSYLILQLAYFMGCSEVFLLGMDMTYTVPTGARNVITSDAPDENHVHPLWFGPGKRWHDPRTDRMRAAFVRARQVFEAAGRSVYNATVGGQLDVFERRSLESALSRPRTALR